nr:PREDICTED: amyloid beta A4 precursor protein-binding family A member 1-like [Equus przewalskii]
MLITSLTGREKGEQEQQRREKMSPDGLTQLLCVRCPSLEEEEWLEFAFQRKSLFPSCLSRPGESLCILHLSSLKAQGLKNQSRVKLNIVRCPPVTTVLIRRPDLRYQLGFSVQNGIICSLMRGGIAERGGVRVGHRIIEINGQSVVATPHEKIVHILSNAVGEIHMKTMPAAMYRLLTAQEQPVYI